MIVSKIFPHVRIASVTSEFCSALYCTVVVLREDFALQSSVRKNRWIFLNEHSSNSVQENNRLWRATFRTSCVLGCNMLHQKIFLVKENKCYDVHMFSETVLSSHYLIGLKEQKQHCSLFAICQFPESSPASTCRWRCRWWSQSSGSAFLRCQLRTGGKSWSVDSAGM